MKNSILLIILIFFFNKILFAENIKISAKNIIIDKNKKTTLFENEVSVLTSEGDNIKSNFAEYNKDLGILTLRKNVYLTDKYNNILIADFIEFKENEKVVTTKGSTKIITSEKYNIESQDLFLNKNENLILSNAKTKGVVS